MYFNMQPRKKKTWLLMCHTLILPSECYAVAITMHHEPTGRSGKRSVHLQNYVDFTREQNFSEVSFRWLFSFFFLSSCLSGFFSIRSQNIIHRELCVKLNFFPGAVSHWEVFLCIYECSVFWKIMEPYVKNKPQTNSKNGLTPPF